MLKESYKFVSTIGYTVTDVNLIGFRSNPNLSSLKKSKQII